MLRLVVAIISFCTVVICVMTGGARQERQPTQPKLPNNLNRTVIYQAISCLTILPQGIRDIPLPHFTLPYPSKRKTTGILQGTSQCTSISIHYLYYLYYITIKMLMLAFMFYSFNFAWFWWDVIFHVSEYESPGFCTLEKQAATPIKVNMWQTSDLNIFFTKYTPFFPLVFLCHL